MEIRGKLIKKLPVVEGVGKKAKWRKQDIIVETLEEYSKIICVSVWGDKIENSVLKEGNILDISINIESREYNEKWYTNIRAWKILMAIDEKPELEVKTQKEAPVNDLDWLKLDDEKDSPF